LHYGDSVTEQFLAAGEVAHMAREDNRAYEFVVEALRDFEEIRPVPKGNEALAFIYWRTQEPHDRTLPGIGTSSSRPHDSKI
jgi:hypothetical protein